MSTDNYRMTTKTNKQVKLRLKTTTNDKNEFHLNSFYLLIIFIYMVQTF